MKRTLLAMLLTGSSMALFAQTTTTTQGNTTNTNSSQTNQSTTNNSTTNSTTDPMNSTTNSGVNASTSWAPGTSPYWGWNSYGIWNNGGNLNTTNNMNGTTMNGSTMNNTTAGVDNMNGTDVTANGNLSSTGSYNAYGTSIASLPSHVQIRFNQDFPTSVNNSYSWNQYGDWFHTYHMNNGRLTQYFYDMKGNGYSLALPVIQTYVPEEIIDKALQKYGANLYSIGMVKTAEGNQAYQIGLLERGQMRMEYLNEDGSSVANVWRTDDAGSLNTTQSNAAMNGTSGQMNNSGELQNNTNGSNIKEMKIKGEGDERKIEIETHDGQQTKIKTKDGKTKIKTKGKNNNNSQNEQQ